jgi:hypothetical protein
MNDELMMKSTDPLLPLLEIAIQPLLFFLNSRVS